MDDASELAASETQGSDGTDDSDDSLGGALNVRYQTKRLLGTGGMSRVLLAYDRVRRQDVAIKVLRQGLAHKWLTAEFRYIASLNHPGIVKVHDFGLTDQGRPFFTMEAVEGPDLFDFSETTDIATTVGALRDALETLDFVHTRGVVHCDIKPSNILVSTDTAGRHVCKLLDFGVAWDPETAADNSGGTAVYMSPEAIEQQTRTARSDLYSVGALLFEILTGQVPYPDEDWLKVLTAQLNDPVPDPRDIAPDTPGPLAEIAVRLLEKDPADRFASARAVSDALGAWLTASNMRIRTRDRTVPALTSRRRLVVGEPRLVGRGTEADILAKGAAALSSYVHPAPPMGPYVVLGPSGSGKTALVADVRIRAQLAGIAWIRVDLSTTAGPGAALAKITSAVAGLSDRPELLALVERALVETNAIDGFLGQEVPLVERLISAAEELGQAMCDVAHERPFALVLDGADAVFPEAIPALRGLTQSLSNAPVMLVATGLGSPGGCAERLGELPGATILPLKPLSLEECSLLVVSLLGELGSSAIVPHVFAQSGGNPGAAVWVVRTLVASESILDRAGRWEVAEHLGGVLPSVSEQAGVKRVAEAAIGALSKFEREVATAASLLGERFTREVLECAVRAWCKDLSSERSDALTRQLVDVRLLVREEAVEGVQESYRFGLAAVAEHLRSGLSTGDVAAASGIIADDIAELLASGASVDLRGFSLHLRRAGRFEEAIEQGLAAAESLVAGGALPDAAEAFIEVLALLEQQHGRDNRWSQVANALGDVERRRGNVDEAIQWYEHVADAGHGGEVELEAQWKLGDLLLERGEVAEGTELVTEALEAAQAQGQTAAVGRSAYTLGFHAIVSGRLDEGEGYLQLALTASSGPDQALLAARTLKLRSLLHWYRGELEASERDARASAAAHIALGVPRGAAEALGVVGGVCQRRGRVEDARLSYQEALPLARKAQWLTGIGKLHNSLAVVEYYSDQWDSACEHYRAALGIADRTGNRVERALLLNNLGLVSANRGEDVAALELYSEALVVARRAGLRKEEARVLGNQGELHVARGELQVGFGNLANCLAIALELKAVDEEIECRRRMLEHDLAAEVDPTHVAELADTLIAKADAEGVASERPHLLRVRGEALALAGDTAEGEEALGHALAGFEALGYGYEAARVSRTGATLATYGLLGFSGVAAKIGDARRLFRRLRAQPELELARHIQETLDHAAEVRAALEAEDAPPQAFPKAKVIDEGSGQLLELLRELGAIRDLDRLLERIVDEALRLSEGSRGFVVLLDAAGSPKVRVTRQMYRGRATACGAGPDDVSRTVVAQVIETRSACFYNPYTADVAPSESAMLLGRSIACLPMESAGSMVGVLYLDLSTSPLPAGSAALRWVEILATQAAVVLENARLYDEQRYKSEILATAADELRHPVEVIVGFAQRLDRDKHALPADFQRTAVGLWEQAQRLEVMLANLLDMGAIEARVLDWAVVSIQVKDLVSSVVEAVQPLAEMHGVAVSLEVPRGLPTLFGNRTRLIQALTNVLDAAVQRSSRGDLVTLVASAVSPSAIGGVRPLLNRERLQRRAGEGFTISGQTLLRVDVMEPAGADRVALVARLGEVFEGGSGETPGERELGLAISRRIIERHGGRLWASERDDGSEGVVTSALLFTLHNPE